ncbi:MAG: glycosyltransferase [Scytolyngbya sp. HA4215-MV1]|nr:glycosyltransferase [Scytolyngbya sp. HA4215-MV1]
METAHSPKPIHVLMMPDYRADNPYQTLLEKALQTQDIQVHFPWGYRRILPIFRMVKGIQPAVSVLHFHWFTPYMKGKRKLVRLVYTIKFLIDILITRFLGVKVVWTVHNLRSHNTEFAGLDIWINRQMAKLADRIIVHHDSTLAQIVQTYRFDAAKAEVIPHGHYRDVYCPAIAALEARQALGLPLIGRVYLHLGMIRPYKGIEFLLQTWQENHSQMAEATLLIAGKALDNDYKLQLTQKIAETEGVQYYPEFVKAGEIHTFFSAADIVVLPFQDILTSGSLILAMSYGKPIIAPTLGGIPETLGSADGLLYDPSDPEGLLKALRRSTQVDLSQLAQLTEIACDRLDWQEIGRKTGELYQKLL